MTFTHDAGFPCMGSTVRIVASGHPEPGVARAALATARALIVGAGSALSRFDASSELSRLNEDGRSEVPVSPLMLRAVGAALAAAQNSGGLVDPTVLPALERAGYEHSLVGKDPLQLDVALRAAPAREAAGPSSTGAWREIAVDRGPAAVLRPPGVRLDLGGIAKGLLADEAARILRDFDYFAVDVCGDIAIGGRRGGPHPVRLEHAFGTADLEAPEGGIATSGIDRRIWRRPDGSPSHHMINPRTGRPAWTGVVSATALAPSSRKAEELAKTALLAGPLAARRVLAAHGGILVCDDGSVRAIPASRRPAVAA